MQSALGLGAAWKLVLGTVFVLLVAFLRRGIIGGIKDLYGLLSTEGANEAADEGGAVLGMIADDERAADPLPAAAVRLRCRAHKRAGDRTRADPAGEWADQALRRTARQQ